MLVSSGLGRVQQWLVGYLQRWEDDDFGYISKNFLRAGWDLHQLSGNESDEHPVSGLTYTAIDAFDDRVKPHRKHRSHMESARRAIERMCKDGVLEESADKRFVRLPVIAETDEHLARRLDVERRYLKSHGRSASDELLVAITGNIVVIELERRLSPRERMSFDTRSVERGDSPTIRVQRLVDYVATRCDISNESALREAVENARLNISAWREEDL